MEITGRKVISLRLGLSFQLCLLDMGLSWQAKSQSNRLFSRNSSTSCINPVDPHLPLVERPASFLPGPAPFECGSAEEADGASDQACHAQHTAPIAEVGLELLLTARKLTDVLVNWREMMTWRNEVQHVAAAIAWRQRRAAPSCRSSASVPSASPTSLS